MSGILKRMKAVILYKPNSEHDSPVQAYVREFAHRTGKALELIDAESREGISMAGLYDIVRFPALVAVRDSGELIQTWLEFEKWPTMNELTYYTKD